MQLANIFFGRQRTVSSPAATPKATPHPVTLTRTFVETYDERCPIAGTWSRLADCDTSLDEPEIPRPAMGSLYPRRAIHFPLIFLQYTTA